MKKRQVWMLAILMIVLLSATYLNAQDLRKEGKVWIGEFNKTFSVSPGGSLIMNEIRGDVDIRTWNKNEVSVHEIRRMDIFTKNEAEAAMKESETGFRQDGNTIRIGGSGFDRKWISSRFKITVPVAFNCDIETQGGDLTISGTKGDASMSTGGGDIELKQIDGTVDVSTGGGDIDIAETTKQVMAKTGGGDIDINNSQGLVHVTTGGGDVSIERSKDRVKVQTGGGDVEISSAEGDIDVQTGGGEITLSEVAGNVSVGTGGGDIDIRNIGGSFEATTGGGDIYAKTVTGALDVETGGGEIELVDMKNRVDVATGGGDVSVEMTMTDFTADHTVNIRTGGGDIDLAIPENLPATIDATIKYNKRNWEDYEITSDFSLKIKTTNDDSRYRVIHATGDINGGGDPVTLRTGGGNIRITKNQTLR